MPTNAELAVRLRLKDEMTKELKGMQGKFRRFANTIQENWAVVAGGILAAQKAFRMASQGIKELVETASKVEQLQVRLQGLLGTAEEGNKVFRDMTELAGQVPKTYEEIMTSATDLSAVVKGGSEEIKKLMPIIVDISAGTGIAVRDVTSQIIRMYSAGAASADMFRERGVLAALGFQAGVSYTTEETMKTITEAWEKGTGKFVGASKALADTFEGSMSMMQDAWFQLKLVIGEEIFVIAKEGIEDLTGIIKSLTTAVKNYRNVNEEIKRLEIEGDIQTQIDLLKEQKRQLNSASAAWFTLFSPDRQIIIGEIDTAIDKLNTELKTIGDTTRELREEAEIEKAIAGDPEKLQEMIDLNFENILSNLELIKEAKALASEDEQARLQAYYNFLNSNDLLTTEQKIALLNKQAEAYKKQGIDEVKIEEWKAKEKAKIDKVSLETEQKAIKARWDAIVSLSQSSVSILRSAAKLSGESWLEAAAVMIEGLASVAKAIATLKAITAPTPWEKAAAIAEVAAAIMSTLVALKGIEEAKKKLTEATVGELNIPKMQEGGIVTKPTLLLAGERGREAIIPLDRARNITASINNTFHFSVTISGTNEEIKEMLEDPDFWEPTIVRPIIEKMQEQNDLVLGSVWDK